jgi:pyridoxine 4-dehydrogenase
VLPQPRLLPEDGRNGGLSLDIRWGGLATTKAEEGRDMTTSTAPGGTLTLAEDLTISRMGYGAMQLAGPGVFGPPKDRDQALAVLREAVELGITHIDTSDFYGPTVVNELIKEALHPYPDELRIVTKVGGRRTDTGAWIPSQEPADLRVQVHENLQHLGLDVLDVVNLRLRPVEGTSLESIAEQFAALADLREQGLIRHLGLSGVSDAQLTEAQAIAPVVTVQNFYNLANRADDALLERCAAQNIAYASFFPLGGFNPLQSQTLTDVAARLGASPQQVALAWLLQRSATTALIPGTSSVAHLRENVAAADLVLPADAVAELDAVAR